MTDNTQTKDLDLEKGRQNDQTDKNQLEMSAVSGQGYTNNQQEPEADEEELELNKTSHTAIMIYFSRSDEDIPKKWTDITALVLIEIMVIFAVCFATYALCFGIGTDSEVGYGDNIYATNWDTTRFRDFKFNSSGQITVTLNNGSNITIWDNVTLVMKKGEGKLDLRSNDYEMSHPSRIQLVIIRMCAMLYLLINIDDSFFSYIYTICNIFKYGYGKKAEAFKTMFTPICALVYLECICCMLAVLASTIQVLIAATVFDVLANVLAITFVLEIDDWAFGVIDRGLLQLSEDDFKFPFDKKQKIIDDDNFWEASFKENLRNPLRLYEHTVTHAVFYIVCLIWMSITQYYHAVVGRESAFRGVWGWVLFLEFIIIMHPGLLFSRNVLRNRRTIISLKHLNVLSKQKN